MAVVTKDNVSVGSRNGSKCLLLEGDLSRHGENCRCGAPHSPLFPANDSKVRLEKIPPSGIWPSSLLNERFKVFK